jgi:hypothetical protein
MSESVDKEKVMTRKNFTSLAIVVVAGLILHLAVFVPLDCSKSIPADTAIKFARAYYRLSPSMTQWMCGASTETCSNKSEPCTNAVSSHDPAECPKAVSGNEPADCPKADCRKELARRVNAAVDNYLYDARFDAAERGFGEDFAKYALYHVETRTEYLDDATAVVHLTAHSRLEINSIYAYVAWLFRIGDTYEVDASIRVKLEDGDWRVCMSSLSSLKMS